MGREPLENLEREGAERAYEQLIRLNEGSQDFWRIGASRDHALLLKEESGYAIYNISLSYPVYLVKGEDMDDPIIHPKRIEPVSVREKEEKLARLLSQTREQLTGNLPKPEDLKSLAEGLSQCAHSLVLAHNDLVIIGNRAFKYIVPVVMETPLSTRAQKSILRKIELNKSIVRHLQCGNR